MNLANLPHETKKDFVAAMAGYGQERWLMGKRERDIQAETTSHTSALPRVPKEREEELVSPGA